jgi:hypothetical protein
MDDLTASILTLLTVSPSIVLLLVLIARGVRNFWEVCALSANAKLTKAMERKIPFQGKLCRETF